MDLRSRMEWLKRLTTTVEVVVVDEREEEFAHGISHLVFTNFTNIRIHFLSLFLRFLCLKVKTLLPQG